MAQLKFYKNHYGEEIGKDRFKTLESLIKYNNGKFKSEKQAKFICNKWQIDPDIMAEPKSWVNLHVPETKGFVFVEIDGYYEFSHGNGKGHVPATILYKLDQNGIVTKYKGKHKRVGNGSSLEQLIVVWETNEPVVPFDSTKPAKQPTQQPTKKVATEKQIKYFKYLAMQLERKLKREYTFYNNSNKELLMLVQAILTNIEYDEPIPMHDIAYAIKVVKEKLEQ